MIQNSQKVATTQISINQWIYKKNMIATPHVIKKWNLDKCYSMDKPWKEVKWKKSQKTIVYVSVQLPLDKTTRKDEFRN